MESKHLIFNNQLIDRRNRTHYNKNKKARMIKGGIIAPPCKKISVTYYTVNPGYKNG